MVSSPTWIEATSSGPRLAACAPTNDHTCATTVRELPCFCSLPAPSRAAPTHRRSFGVFVMRFVLVSVLALLVSLSASAQNKQKKGKAAAKPAVVQASD